MSRTSERLSGAARWGLLLACIAVPSLPGAALADNLATDSRTTGWIERAIEQDPRVADSKIEVTTVAGMVTLEGRAATLAARDFAALEALKIRGVLGVVNHVDVVATPRSADDVTRDLRDRIRQDELLVRDASIGVDVVADTVHLQGVVPTATASEEAELLARETPGVAAVENGLRVAPPAEMDDGDVAESVRAVLRRDVYLTRQPIDVEVEDGLVTLTGEVRNPYEKERAGLLPAWLPRVRSVDNELSVAAGPDDGTRAVKPELPDDEIATYVRVQLRRDERVEASRVRIDVLSGRVLLSGAVPDPLQREIAREDARYTIGVESVTDELEVRPLPRSDAEIRDAATAALRAEPALAGRDLDVGVDGGVVFLRGHVANAAEKLKATEVVLGIPGVVRVVDELVSDEDAADFS